MLSGILVESAIESTLLSEVLTGFPKFLRIVLACSACAGVLPECINYNATRSTKLDWIRLD